jgi:ubiquinol-cytochrome c reductase iron-sulfur subunit
MAALQAAKKYATLPPTVRAAASGVPNAPSLNLSAQAPDAHHHGHAGRSDMSKWAGGYRLSSSGLINKSFTTGKPVHLSRATPKNFPVSNKKTQTTSRMYD